MAITESELEAGLSTVAKLINAYGEKYRPVFERLEMELETKQSRFRRVESRLSIKHIESNSARAQNSNTKLQ
ncbi:MAG: hypothetical protein JKX72_03510 [Robiginitomaculum sp.]|nr:hypothetical protein [Robiginitomaculum sp.]